MTDDEGNEPQQPAYDQGLAARQSEAVAKTAAQTFFPVSRRTNH